jgi:hypothetical protein
MDSQLCSLPQQNIIKTEQELHKNVKRWKNWSLQLMNVPTLNTNQHTQHEQKYPCNTMADKNSTTQMTTFVCKL